MSHIIMRFVKTAEGRQEEEKEKQKQKKGGANPGKENTTGLRGTMK